MTLLDEQYAYRGLTFGAATDYHVNRAEGFEGFEVRSSDSDQPRNDGALRGLDYVAPKTISFELSMIEEDADGSGYEDLWSQVRAAFQPSLILDYPLTFKRAGQPERLINCRPIQLVRTEEFKRFNRLGFPPVVLRAVDPRIYSSEEHTGNVPVYAASSGGMDWSVANWPVDFTTGLQNEFVAINAGTANAYPLLRFYGPTVGTCTAVTLTNTTTGQTFVVSTTITTGQILTGDMTAAINGTDALVVSLSGSSRYGSWSLPRSPFYLAPGSNTLRFQITGTSTDMIANVTWRDTWLA
ncbi:MAG: phage tail family protein [Actinomycetota bacterium]|nr:phage tail family protein [Actinomycetota bacterium]